MPHYVRITTVLCLLCASCLLAATPVRVNVDATTAIVTGDTARISANLFGITAFEGGPAMVADLDYRARVLALRPGCFRFAGNIQWCSPPGFDPSWYGTPAALKQFGEILLFGSRYPTGRFLPVVRQLGAEPMCSLGGVPEFLKLEGTRNPADFDKWAAICVAYVGLWKVVDPDMRLVQIWNEPNAHWYKDPRAGDHGATAANLHIDMANKVAAAIKERFPDVIVGGPVLCWAPGWPPNQKGKKPWYTWTDWTLPWLEKTADTIDFFDFHVYSIAPADFAVQVGMLVNQAELTQGRRIPVWITESNINLPPEALADPAAIWRRRLLPYERFLLQGVLPQADKIHGNLYHDLHARRHTLLPRGAADPDPMYWLLWILRDLRGTRIKAEADHPTITPYATVEEDRVTVVLFNDSEEESNVALDLTIPGGYWTGPRVRVLREAPSGTCETARIETRFARDGAKATGSLDLPPFGTASITFRMAAFATPVRRQHTLETFGNRTVQFLAGGASVEVLIPVTDPTGGKAALRLGMLGPEPTDSISCTMNGTRIPVGATALQDVAIPPGLLKQTNRLVIRAEQSAPNPRLALGFASVRQTLSLPSN